MNNRQSILPLLIALVLAILAGTATFFYLTNTSAQAQNSAAAQLAALGTQVDVLVPTGNISPGTQLGTNNLTTAKRYLADIQGLNVAVYSDTSKIVGKYYAKAALYQGEPILWDRLTLQQGQTDIPELPSKQIPPQKLGFALAIAPDQAVGGLIGKDDIIDIYASKVGTSTLVFSSVHVLCVAGQFPCGGSFSTTDSSNSSAGFGGSTSGSSVSGGVQPGGKTLILDIDDSQVTTLTGLLTSGQQIYVSLHSSNK